MVKDEKKKSLIGFILIILIALVTSAIILFWYLPTSTLLLEIKASIIIGFVIILWGIILILFKIILEEYFEMVNPGSNALQRTIQFLIIGGLIIITLSILSLMKMKPLFN